MRSIQMAGALLLGRISKSSCIDMTGDSGRRVAAIIPTMNRAEQLEKALASVFAQTYDEIEAIVVDGGSNDRTIEVVSSYQSEYPGQLTYVRNEEPKGLPAARNRAAESTSSEFLAFLDDDDRWHQEKIEKQVERINGDVGLCYTGLTSETPDGEYVHTKRPTLKGDIYEDLIVRNDIGTPSTVMVTREAYDEVEGFDEELNHQEDWDFYIRVARKYEIACVSEPLVTRLYHTEAMSRDVEMQKEYRERILERYSEELQAHGLEDEAWSVHHRDTGTMWCLNGETIKGRREFVRALARRPDAYVFVLYIMSNFGTNGFNFLVNVKRSIGQFQSRLGSVINKLTGRAI